MEHVAKFVVSAVELAEAELRSLQHGVTKFGLKLAAVLGAGLLGIMGILFLFRALFLALEYYLGPIWAWAIVGAGFLCVAAGLAIFALKKGKASIPVPLPHSAPPVPHVKEGVSDEAAAIRIAS